MLADTRNATPDAYQHRIAGYYEFIFTFARRCLRRRRPYFRSAVLDAADITQTVFVKLLGYRARAESLVSDAERFVPYLRVMVHHEVTNAIRREDRQARTIAGCPVPAPEPEPLLERPDDALRERAERVQRVLALLPNDRARCVVEHVLKGDSIKDIANELHLKPNVVSQTKCRALKILRRVHIDPQKR